jgi:hypothetical protein
VSTVAVIANPVSGRDVRRLLANAARSSIQDKVTIVRRVAIGAVAGGATRLVVLPDPHSIAKKALSTMQLDAEVVELTVPRTHDERETVAAAAALREMGVGAVVVLGGDGTNRVVAKGWADAPIVPLSTGTNNVFPAHIEPTIGGAAAGLVASGAVELDVAARRTKVVHVEIEGEEPDFALVDAVLTADTVVGDRTPFDAAKLRAAVIAIADPAAVGISPIGGLLQPCGRDEDAALSLRFGEGRALTVPISPGLYTRVGVVSCDRIELGRSVEVRGPGILAFDGDRRRVLRDGQVAHLRVDRDGPWVIDVPQTMGAAAARGVFVE